MISCAHAAELISRSLETNISWWQRFALRLHLFGCDLCRRFKRQLALVEEAGRRIGDGQNIGMREAGLSKEARKRIQEAVAQANQDRPA
jgi:hypothetical protein